MSKPMRNFPAFLRHRYRVHVEGWLCIATGLLTGYYVDLFSHEPLWITLPTSFIAAFFVVAVMVAVAALLRFPWWFLAPLTAVSMACEWALRRLLPRPWRRRPQPRTPFLSNPFAVWQCWRNRQRRHARHTSRMAERPEAIVLPFPKTPRIEAPRDPLGASVLEYVFEAFEAHWIVWLFVIPLGVFLWLWLGEATGFLVALVIATLLTAIFMPTLIIPLAAALLALVSATLAGLGLTPRQRQAAIARARPLHALAPQTPGPPPPASATPAAQGNRWLLPLLIGLIIGNAWADQP